MLKLVILNMINVKGKKGVTEKQRETGLRLCVIFHLMWLVLTNVTWERPQKK